MTKKKDQPINMGKFLVSKGVKPKKSEGPLIMRDYYNGSLSYISPLSGKRISSRDDRKAELKKYDVREVDPSEGPHREGTSYLNKGFASRRNPKDWGKYTP